MRTPVYIAGPARTAIGSFGGALSETPAPELGSAAARASLERAGVPPDAVSEVIFGNVIGAGLGQNPARQVAIGAGLDVSIGATTVNKVCGSGLKAVMLAAQAVQCGDADVVVAGGAENMSRSPYLLERSRKESYTDDDFVDTLLRDGLWDVYGDVHMGACGDRCAERCGFTREQQDDFAVESYRRAIASADRLASEIVPVNGISADEEPARFNEEKLRSLRPAFGEGGTVTAGNASSINDGAASVLVLSEQKVKELGVTPQARVLGYAAAAREPEWFTLAPITAVRRLLDRIGLSVANVDLFEINEAFAAVAMAAMQELDIPHDRLNVHGGAVALGHPIGASGARTLVTLLNAMAVGGAKVGVDALCIGGGEAVALAVEACS